MHCWPTVCSRGAKDTLPGACPWSSQPLGGPRKGEGDVPWASHLLLGARILDQTQSGIQPSCCQPRLPLRTPGPHGPGACWAGRRARGQGWIPNPGLQHGLHRPPNLPLFTGEVAHTKSPTLPLGMLGHFPGLCKGSDGSEAGYHSRPKEVGWRWRKGKQGRAVLGCVRVGRRRGSGAGGGGRRQTDRDRDGGTRDAERQRWERDVGREKQGETETGETESGERHKQEGDRDRRDRQRATKTETKTDTGCGGGARRGEGVAWNRNPSCPARTRTRACTTMASGVLPHPHPRSRSLRLQRKSRILRGRLLLVWPPPATGLPKFPPAEDHLHS